MPRDRDAPCPRDGALLQRRTVGGRTTYSCPVHQHWCGSPIRLVLCLEAADSCGSAEHLADQKHPRTQVL